MQSHGIFFCPNFPIHYQQRNDPQANSKTVNCRYEKKNLGLSKNFYSKHSKHN